MEPRATSTESAHASAQQLLDRHGILTREAVASEGVVGGFSAVYPVLKLLEERGHVRRGYFVAGLGATQFAAPGAVDRLRDFRDAHDMEMHPDTAPNALVLAATDPAQPYGATLPWPANGGRPQRSAGALVVMHDGECRAWCDPRGYSLVTFEGSRSNTQWADALVMLVKDGRRRTLEIRKIDGAEPDPEDTVVLALERVGFVRSYRGWVLRD